MLNNRYQAYKQQSILTMTPGGMLTALYDGILKELGKAQIAFQKNDVVEINRSLQKAQDIMKYLRNTLDFKYEISNNLNTLYTYFLNVMRRANFEKDPTDLDEVAKMVTELRDTYIQADRMTCAQEA